jgi:hypothetical protein
LSAFENLTTPLAANVAYTLTISNVKDLGGVTVPNTQLPIYVPPFVTESTRAAYNLGGTNNVAVLEAEDYNLNTPGANGQTWAFTTSPPDLLPTATDTNYSGSGSMIIPEAGNASSYNPGDKPVGNPQLDYKVYFANAGNYKVWVRGVEGLPIGGSDSVNFGLDGAIAYRINGAFPQTQGYVWGQTPTPTGAVLTVPTAGVHVFNIWMREDGFTVDKVVLASDFSYVPTGLGPAESPIVGPPGAITLSGANVVLTWPGGGVLQSSTNVVKDYTDIVGSSSPYTNVPGGVQKYYRVRE